MASVASVPHSDTSETTSVTKSAEASTIAVTYQPNQLFRPTSYAAYAMPVAALSISLTCNCFSLEALWTKLLSRLMRFPVF
jgi:hypothetical protein